MKVTFTRRSRINMSDFDFLTEDLFQEKSKAQKRKRLTNNVSRRARNLKALTIYEASGISAVEASGETVDLAKNAADAVSGDTQKAISAFKNMMSKFGNSLTGMFKQLIDWIKELLTLASRILKPLKTLWGKIKSWFSKLHINYRAKSLSMVVVCCIGFIGSMIANWLCKFMYRMTGSPRDIPPNFDDITDDFKYGIGHYLKKVKVGHAESVMPRMIEEQQFIETAVFIETFGEILREDSNGGMFMAMARKAITGGKKAVAAFWKILSGSAGYLIKHSRIKRLIDFLTTSVHGSDAMLTNNVNR